MRACVRECIRVCVCVRVCVSVCVCESVMHTYVCDMCVYVVYVDVLYCAYSDCCSILCILK